MRWDRIIQGDCLEELRRFPEASVDLIFADPPFNIGYEYDKYDDRKQKTDYLNWTEAWLEACQRLLKPTGSFFVAIGDEYVAEHKVRLDQLGLTLRNWIVWHYTFGVHCSKKFTRSHAHILYYVANPKRFTFNDDTIRVPSARQLVYADRRANPKGRVPDDTWILRPQEDPRFFQAETDSWSISRVCGTFKERMKHEGEDGTAHPCQMPEAVLERIIKATSNEGDVVLDPFAGSGTTLAVAKKLGRKFLGIELSENYVTAIKSRLSQIDASSSTSERLTTVES
jgi:site-specific DNA-methyltransferase (adenine-specific)